MHKSFDIFFILVRTVSYVSQLKENFFCFLETINAIHELNQCV